jgi:hypothetical protein
LKGDQHKTKRLSLVDEWQQEFELLWEYDNEMIYVN